MTCLKKIFVLIILLINKGSLLFANSIPYLQIISPKPVRLEDIAQPFNRMNLQPIPKGQKQESTFSPTAAPKVIERQITITKAPKQPSNAESQQNGNTTAPQHLSAEEIVLYIQDENKNSEPLPFKELNLNLANLPQPSSDKKSAQTQTDPAPTETKATQTETLSNRTQSTNTGT